MESRDATLNLTEPNIEPNSTTGYSKSATNANLDKYFNEHDLYGLFYGMFSSLANDQPDRPYDYLIKGIQRLKAVPKGTQIISQAPFFMTSCQSAGLATFEWIHRNGPKFPNRHRPRLEVITCETYEPSEESMKEPIAIPKSPQTRELIDNAIRDDQVLGSYSEDPRNIVIDIMSEQKVSAGEILFREGDPATNFYVIETGKFLISAKDKADEILVAGMGFNSIALQYIQKQKSTVTALEPGTLWTVDRVTCNRALIDLTYRKWKL